METSLAKAKRTVTFPQSSQMAIQNKKDVSDTLIQRRTITNINRDRRNALERSIKSISVGAEIDLHGHNPRPYFCRGLDT